MVLQHNPIPGTKRSTWRALLLSSALPTLPLALPATAVAATTQNSASVTAPAGAIEANTANNSATDTNTVLAPIVARADSAGGVNGANGATGVLNVLAGDTINGAAASTTNAVLSAVGAVPPQLAFDPATGTVDVRPGTPAGTYSFTYEICERLNPTNCETASVSITVAGSPVVARADTVTGVNGASGATAVANVFAGDTINGAAASTTNAIVSAVGAVPAQLAFDPATGTVDVRPGTPAGTYSFTYQLCERLNPTNCETASVSITVAGSPVVASADTATGVNGANGATGVVNVLAGDTVNGAAASTTNAIVSAVGAVPAQLAFDPATGAVDVRPGTPAGTYSFTYQLCERLNPTNCETATASVTVAAAAVVAAADNATSVNGATGATAVANVLGGDTVNGVPASPTNAILSAVSAVPPQLAFDPATGTVDVRPGTPAGTYSFTYQLCERLNPTNCTTATASVTVAAAAVVASADSATGVNGASGATAVANVLTGDTINGAAATAANAIVSAVGAVPAQLVFDPATGAVDVRPGTPAGTYSFTYQLCERLNPTNCTTATASVTVAAATIAGDADSVAAVNGAAGAAGALDVLAGDTLNGVQASLTAVALSVVTPASAINGGPVPVLDPATGLIDVPAGTPAGTYQIGYRVCEQLNPANCATANASVTVAASPVVASGDTVTGVNGANGATAVANVLTGDTINGAAATAANAIVRAVGAVPPQLAFDPATGAIDVLPGTPAGTYSFTYQLCERLNPTNCTTATASVTVAAAAVVASADSATGVNGATGATAVANVLTGDTINGAAATATNAIVSAVGAVPAQLAFDPATGTVDVRPGTPAGTYSFTYQLCERLNPTNCVTATASVTVVAPVIAAAPDAPGPVNSATGGVNVVNAFANDTLNGVPVSAALVTATVVSPAASINGGSVPTLDPATGQVDVPAGTPAGTYAIGYRVCETLNPTNCATSTVTVVVEPARSSLSGTVYTDVNIDRTLDSGDVRRAGWVVEIVRDGAVVATTTTDAQGNYAVSGLLSGGGYSIQFRNPDSNVVFGTIANQTLAPNAATTGRNFAVDPSGVLYDSVTRGPLAGATITLATQNGTPLPAACFAAPSQATQRTGANGEYRFDLVPGGAPECPTRETDYRIIVTPPAGYAAVSSVLAPQPGVLDPTGSGAVYRVSPTAAPPTGSDATYFLTLRLAAGDPGVVFNHIPLDPFLARTPLILTKVSPKRSASTGELIPYEITVRNPEGAQRAGVDVVDILPPGMRYVAGSASVDGVAREPVAANGHRELVWRGQVIPANGSVRYRLTLLVGAGVGSGARVNTGVAEDGTTGAEISNRGTAAVTIVPSAVFDCADVIGKVFEDRNRNGDQDAGEPGVPGVRLATVNGLLVTTDAHGRYHIACAAVPDARIGSNFVLKLDPRTLPLGWRPTADNPRAIRLTRGKSGTINFGVAPADARQGGE